jgi:hypothetical protein
MRFSLLLTLTALGTMFVAQAGPPLICHPFQIGDSKSLPWGGGSGWDNPDSSYNVKNLANDTLAILDHASTVLVRMETLRRAAVYGYRDAGAAQDLLTRLAQRESAAEKSTKPNATAFFDYGYFLASLKQADFKYKEDLTRGIDGYTFVQKALAIEPESGEMHFAAAVMASWPARPVEKAEHLRKARAVNNDALLASNLKSVFQ